MPLRIEVVDKEIYDEETNTFYNIENTVLVLEHSLKSLYRWEALYKTPFMSKYDDNRMNAQETFDYIKCMLVEPKDVDDEVLKAIAPEDIKRIMDYINDPMTATTFKEDKKGGAGVRRSREIITAEIIYYWLVSLQIPFECDTWNLNQLLTLVRVCSIKNAPGKKMSNKEILASNKMLNAQRRAKLGSRG